MINVGVLHCFNGLGERITLPVHNPDEIGGDALRHESEFLFTDVHNLLKLYHNVPPFLRQ